MLSFLYSTLPFLVALAVLVTFHELGHYWVARWCNVKVLCFSFGFGKRLFSWQVGKDQTEWVISAFPLGGYVKMLDEREAPVAPHEASRAFNRQSLFKRSLIVAAGPIANFLLAFVLLWGVFAQGIETIAPRIGQVFPNTLAMQSGFEIGDTILTVANQPIQSWQDFYLTLLDRAIDKKMTLVKVRTQDQHIVERQLDLTHVNQTLLEGNILTQLGLSYVPYLNKIGKLEDSGPAAQAGLQVNDVLIALNGKPLSSWAAWAVELKQSHNQVLDLTIERDKQTLTIRVKPKQVEENGKLTSRIGISPAIDELWLQSLRIKIKYSGLDAMQHAYQKVIHDSIQTLSMLGKMVIGQLSLKNIGGPLTIAGYAGESAKISLIAYLEFLAAISISLGVLNLLPIPLLDGGHLMYYMAELVTRRPVSQRIMEIGQQIGIGLLVLLMGIAFFNDFYRLFS